QPGLMADPAPSDLEHPRLGGAEAVGDEGTHELSWEKEVLDEDAVFQREGVSPLIFAREETELGLETDIAGPAFLDASDLPQKITVERGTHRAHRAAAR